MNIDDHKDEQIFEGDDFVAFIKRYCFAVLSSGAGGKFWSIC
jgi:hypothetical protein